MTNLNSGKEWSEMDPWDFKNHLAQGAMVEETLDFLCRDEDEVREKMKELGLKESLTRKGSVFPNSLSIIYDERHGGA
jgi:hypothetical protein